VSILDPQMGENSGFFTPEIFRGTYETAMGHNQFQNIPRRVAEFHENRSRDVEKPVDGKKIKTSVKHNSVPLSLKRYAGDCMYACMYVRNICVRADNVTA